MSFIRIELIYGKLKVLENNTREFIEVYQY